MTCAPMIADEIKRYLRTGDADMMGNPWPGDILERGRRQHADIRGALTSSARPLLDVLQRRSVPNGVLVVATEADVAGPIGERLAWVRGKQVRAGRATAYVCERGTCQFPTTEPEVFARQLGEVRPYR